MTGIELSRIEGRILRVLSRDDSLEISELAGKLGVKVDYIRYFIELLKNKGLVRHEHHIRIKYTAADRLKRMGNLPEYYLYNIVKESSGRIDLENARKVAKERYPLSDEDVSAGLGYLVRNKIVRLERSDDKRIIVIAREFPEKLAILVDKLLSEEGLSGDDTSRLEEFLSALLGRPGLVDQITDKREIISITPKGIEVSRRITEYEVKEEISELTPELIRTRGWVGREFKEYDVSLPGPPVFGGRRHPMRELIREIREIFSSLGFVEEEGPLIELAFWNFDALFQPQDHPARDMHDTFYIKRPKYGDIIEKDVVEKVRSTHEDGWKTGSCGWKYRWNIDDARKLVLRTHTTALTVKKVYEYGEVPAKIFSIGKVFRNESIDYKHLAELHQVDGIVIDPNTNLRELLGVLKSFYEKLGFKKIAFWPSYFPYTEPSVQVSVYVEELDKYLEMAGSGIFRPEVTVPLGVKWPVLAWGIGIERILMLKYGWDDIRTIYTSDIGLLRGFRKCL
jgi:phenylalanyl-tRNA synthetase alpha chain